MVFKEKMIKFISFLVIILFSSSATAFTVEQKETLAKAYEIGKPHYSKTMAAIALEETNAGVTGPVGDSHLVHKSYGVMQVQVPTARYAMRLCPDLKRSTDKKAIINDLINDETWNIKIAKCYFKSLEGSWREKVRNYNRGPNSSVDNIHYLNGIINNFKRLESFFEKQRM